MTDQVPIYAVPLHDLPLILQFLESLEGWILYLLQE